jgi:hypothetical protein
MKIAVIGFVAMLLVLVGLYVVREGGNKGVGAPAGYSAPATSDTGSAPSAPTAPAAPAQGGNDPFGSLKIN